MRSFSGAFAGWRANTSPFPLWVSSHVPHNIRRYMHPAKPHLLPSFLLRLLRVTSQLLLARTKCHLVVYSFKKDDKYISANHTEAFLHTVSLFILRWNMGMNYTRQQIERLLEQVSLMRCLYLYPYSWKCLIGLYILVVAASIYWVLLCASPCSKRFICKILSFYPHYSSFI